MESSLVPLKDLKTTILTVYLTGFNWGKHIELYWHFSWSFIWILYEVSKYDNLDGAQERNLLYCKDE